MSMIKLHRPSPALVVAVLALLVAMSGTAYAATMLPKNSVGTAQLKKGAVTLTKISSSAQGSLKPRAWASVKNGVILASSGITGTLGHTSDGIFDFTLKKPATNCAAVASENPNGGRIVGGIAQANISSGTDLRVETQYYSGSSFAVSDEGFSVVVLC
jgi:hypothetical protein